MPAEHITAKFVAQVKPPASGRVYYMDTKLPGFSVCVSATGSKVFYRIGRNQTGVTRTKIEAYPKITVEKARELCVKVHADILDGKPPRTRMAKSCKTVSVVWEWHLKHNLQPNNRSWKDDQRTYDRAVKQWANMPIQDLTRTMIVEKKTELLEKTSGRSNGPGAANRFLTVIRGICKTACAEGWCGRNPAEQVKKCRIQKRARFIDEDEIVTFFEHLGKLKPAKQDYFLLALFTGARRSNVCAMAWADINLQRAVWSIPGDASKNKEPMILPLTDVAMEILKRRRKADPDAIWVFPGRAKSGHFVEPKHQWKQLLTDSGMENLRIHDLRRTLGSWQSIAGTPLQTIGASMGHVSMAATLIYARLNTQVVRKSVQETADAIGVAVAAKKSEKSPK